MDLIFAFFKNHSLIILLSAATVVSFLWIVKFSEKLKIKKYVALILAVVHTVLGVVLVKIFAFLESGGTLKGGMSLFGAVFGLPVLYFFGSKIFKRKITDVFDIFTMATVITMFCARVNCILSGCCLGIELPDGMRVPTREIELVYYFVMFNILFVSVQKDRMFGRAYPLYMFTYGVFRFIIEFFRVTDRLYFGVLHISHFWSVISIIIGLAFFIALTKRHKEIKKKKS